MDAARRREFYSQTNTFKCEQRYAPEILTYDLVQCDGSKVNNCLDMAK
jgi:hypothetical protein